MDKDGFPKILAYLIAVVFWLGIICGALMLRSADVKRKQIEKKLISEKKYKKEKHKAGIISFFRNKEAMLCDIIMFVSLITLVIIAVTSVSAGWIIVVLLVLFVCAFYLHCFLNGKNYIFIKTAKNSKFEESKNE